MPHPDELPPAPPYAPRKVGFLHLFSRLWGDVWFLVAMIMAIISIVFLFAGVIIMVTLPVPTAAVPFLFIDIFMLLFAGAVVIWRFGLARGKMRVFRDGRAVLGEVLEVAENRSVQVNGRHPWKVRYFFESFGREYEGEYGTLNAAVGELQEGQKVYVLYLQDNPEENLLWPFWEGSE